MNVNTAGRKMAEAYEASFKSSPASKMPLHYGADELKGIGQQCRNRLPPANAVQAMFMYEMQRETELEQLFKGIMFHLARDQDHSKAHETAIAKLEKQVKALQSQITSSNVDRRFEMANSRIDAENAKLNHLKLRLDAKGEGTAILEGKVQALEKINAANESTAAARHAEITVNTSEINKQCEELRSVNEDIGVLFDERDALVTLLSQANERIDKLEGLVRALTLQSGSGRSSASSSPTAAQLLLVQTTNGQAMDLSVPKGHPLVPHNKEEIRSFTPGQRWMS